MVTHGKHYWTRHLCFWLETNHASNISRGQDSFFSGLVGLKFNQRRLFLQRRIEGLLLLDQTLAHLLVITFPVRFLTLSAAVMCHTAASTMKLRIPFLATRTFALNEPFAVVNDSVLVKNGHVACFSCSECVVAGECFGFRRAEPRIKRREESLFVASFTVTRPRQSAQESSLDQFDSFA